MKRSLITQAGLIPFSGGASIHPTTSQSKRTISREQEIRQEIFRRSHLKTFMQFIAKESK